MKVIPSDEMTAVIARVIELLDPGSFMEMGERVSARFTEFYHPDSVEESDGVVTGYGTINGNLVFVFAQDADVMGGTFGEQHGRKIVDLYEHAIKAKAPVIGQCGGGMSISAQLADFLYIEKDKGSIFVNPQGVVGNAIGDNPYVEALDDGTFEWPEIIEKIHDVIDILPSSSDFAPDILEVSDEELNRSCDGIADMLGDAKAILAELSDDGKIIECRAGRGRSMVTAFIRVAGQPIGVVACNEFEGRKRLSSAGCNKAAKMIDLCTRFHIPLLTITDTEGYKTDSATETFLPSAADRMVRALTASDVPKFNLVTGSIVGSAYSMMNSKGLGADYVFMWDSANVSIVDPRQATEVIFGKWTSELEQQYRDTQSSAVALARHGFVDKVIAPEDSRKYLIGALQVFVNSR